MPTPTPLTERRLLTVKQATEYTGMGKTTLYAEAAAGRLKMLKMGGATRIERTELDRWIDTAFAA